VVSVPDEEITMLLRFVIATANEGLRKKFEKKFDAHDLQVVTVGAGQAAFQNVVRSCGDIIVIDADIVPKPLESSLAMINSLPEAPTTVVLHEDDSPDDHAMLVAAGADVVLYSKLTSGRLIEALETTVESRRQFQIKNRFERLGSVGPRISDFVSRSEAMQIFIEEVRSVIPSDSTLLILGETGVGKEHLARAIHSESPRSPGPLVTVNTAALPDQLLESELFGHEQGAFTGAIRSRRGAFEMAHGGTLFLDEIGDLPLHLQAKLLRVLQDYEVRPVGSESSVFVDVRIIAATNSDLEREVLDGQFRRDLFYRLSVVTLTVPPLRQRREDISDLVELFIERNRLRIGREVTGLDDETLDALCTYDWPGTIRELMNVIERAMLLCKTEYICMRDLPHVFHKYSGTVPAAPQERSYLPDSWSNMTLPEAKGEMIERLERDYLTMVLKESHGRIDRAARRAGIHPRGLYDKMKQYGLRKEDFKADG
jgi:DNA-binding NtrC family response regulator